MNQRRYLPIKPDPYVERAGKARDLLIAANLIGQIRPITKAAAELAGADHEKYIAYVQQQIAARRPVRLPAVDIVTDVLIMTNEGYGSADIAQYLRRAYGLD